MKNKILVTYLSFCMTIGFGQKLPEYHRGVVNSYHTPQRGMLLSAVKAQNLSLVDSLVKQGYDINEPNIYGMTILAEALNTLKDTSFIDSLLTRGVCLDCGKYISYYIIEKGSLQNFDAPINNAIVNKELFPFFIKKYQKLGLTKVLSERSVMETAITVVDLVAFIELSNYFDFKNINSDKNYDGQTLLTQLAHSIAISYLFLQLQDRNSELAPLLKDSEQMISFLLKKGADINKPNDKGETALTLVKNIPQLVKFLKKKGAKY